MLKEGLTFEMKKIVTENDTAAKVASGAVEVFATPIMIAFMENTALNLAKPHLEDGYTTVGTKVNVKHLKATLVGAEVVCKAELKKVDGKRLLFEVKVFEGDILVGDGEHERYIVNEEKFIKNLQKNS